MKYVPEWMPRASFHKRARACRATTLDMLAPFMVVKKAFVSRPAFLLHIKTDRPDPISRIPEQQHPHSRRHCLKNYPISLMPLPTGKRIFVAWGAWRIQEGLILCVIIFRYRTKPPRLLNNDYGAADGFGPHLIYARHGPLPRCPT